MQSQWDNPAGNDKRYSIMKRNLRGRNKNKRERIETEGGGGER